MKRLSTGTGLGQAAEYGVIVLAVVLGWQMVVALFAERAPVEMAVRLAPTSTIALVRAAESEVQADRRDNAVELARSALRIAPFNARALSIIGRIQDQAGDPDAADQTLTLAGNWSLRDDPAHAWLMRRRLVQGDYASAFAHAETLVRRQSPNEPRLFELFTLAAAEPRGLSALVDALSARPPWGRRYLDFLLARDDADGLLATLAVNLEARHAPLSDLELGQVYQRWLGRGRLTAIRDVQRRLDRPHKTAPVWNGDFSVSGDGTPPLNWSINAAPGFSAQVSDTGDVAQGRGLYVEYDGLAGGVIAGQMLLLDPGAATIRLRQKLSGDMGAARLEWRVICVEAGTAVGRITPPTTPDASGWSDVSGVINVPAAGCAAQWLQLTARPGDRRRTISAWFDDLSITPVRGR